MGSKKDGDYRYAPDGTLLVQKMAVPSRWGIGSGFPERKGWYRCSNEDPDRHYRNMVLFGWFGWHKFKERRGLAGIFYLVTCGCFGVFYFYDLALMLAGNYSYKDVSYQEGEQGLKRQVQKIYYAPLGARKKGMLLLLPAFLLLAAAYFCLYQPVGTALARWCMGRLAGPGMEELAAGLFRLVW